MKTDPTILSQRLLEGLARLRLEPWSDALTTSGARGWLVGGTVRDLALGRTPRDIDLAFAPGTALDIGRDLAARLAARFVLLHADFGVCRVVLTDGGWVDLTDLQAETIEADLPRRDLTINAVAVPWPDGEPLIDPTGGLADLAARIARVPSAEVLRDDPVRVLRVFRFAADFDLTVEAATQEDAGVAAAGLAEAPGERVWEELRQVLSPRVAATWVSQLADCGALDVLFPSLAAGDGVAQPSFHHLDVRAHSIEAARRVDDLVADPFFAGAFSERSNRALLRLAALLHDVGKPSTSTVDEQRGYTRFPGHAQRGATFVVDAADRLRLSKVERMRLRRLVSGHMRPHQLAELHSAGRLTNRAVRRFLLDLGGDWLLLLALARADILATDGPDAPSDGLQRAIDFAAFIRERRERHATQVANEGPLATGDDLLELGIAPGPAIGRFLDVVADRRFADPDFSRAQALDLVRRMAQDEGLLNQPNKETDDAR